MEFENGMLTYFWRLPDGMGNVRQCKGVKKILSVNTRLKNPSPFHVGTNQRLGDPSHYLKRVDLLRILPLA